MIKRIVSIIVMIVLFSPVGELLAHGGGHHGGGHHGGGHHGGRHHSHHHRSGHHHNHNHHRHHNRHHHDDRHHDRHFDHRGDRHYGNRGFNNWGGGYYDSNGVWVNPTPVYNDETVIEDSDVQDDNNTMPVYDSKNNIIEKPVSN